MPTGVRVETAQENADRSSEEIRDGLGFLRTFLLVFGFIAVFVGSFLIFNTFSITVAQRISEFGMLRTLGASRRQILTTVMVEAMAIGLLGAIARDRRRLRDRRGDQRPLRSLRHRPADAPSLVLESRTVIVALLVGVVVTFVSSLVPALRSTRVPPIAALHAFAPDPHPPPPARLPRALDPAGVAGLCLVCLGLFGSGGAGTRAGLIGGGAVVVVIAVSLFSPRLVPPLAALAGWPLERLRHLTGRLARENAERNPSRTAITAAALMIGIALVAFVTVFAAGLKSTVAQVVDENFAGGLVIQNTDGFSPIPNGTAEAPSKVPGVETVATIRSVQAKLLEGGRRARGESRRPLARHRERPSNVEWKRAARTLPQTRRPRGDRLGRLRRLPRARSRGPLRSC